MLFTFQGVSSQGSSPKLCTVFAGPWMHLQNSLPPEGLKPGRFGAGSRVLLSSFHISTKYYLSTHVTADLAE